MPSLANVIAKTPKKKKLSISDWKWRSPAEVKAELNLTDTPQHIQDFGTYMLEMADKAKGKKLTPRDLVKAYTITRSSIQRQATDVNNVIKAGLPLDPKLGKVRPEGAFSEWLGTPQGQRYLNAAEKGQVDQDAIADAVKVMAPFGKHEKDIPDALTWAAQNLPGREGQAADLVARAADGKSTPDEWRGFAKDVKGIGPAKAGFWASLLGRGDLPTLDARQVMIHTGKPTSESKQFISNKRLGDKAVDRLAKRQADMAVPMPDELKPFYQHLTHHNVWDAAGKTKTTHADVINAMKNYSIAAGLGGGAVAASAAFEPADASVPKPELPQTDDPAALKDYQKKVGAYVMAQMPSAKAQVLDAITQAGAGINRGVASIPGLPKDLADLADWGLDWAGVSKNETLRNVVNPGRMWPISGQDSIDAWESLTGKLPEAKTNLGSIADFAGQLLSPGPGELTAAAVVPMAGKKLIRLEDLAKAKGVKPVDLANSYTKLKYGARRGPKDTAPEDWVKEVVETPTAPVKDLKLEDLIGQTISMTPGDTATVDKIVGVNGKQFSTPIEPGGGPRYTLDPKRMAEGAAWAGAPSPTSATINRTKKLIGEGHDPVMAHGTMGFDAIDYNSSMVTGVLNELLTGKYTKKALKGLDQYVREALTKGPHEVPGFDPKGFPGINDPKKIEQTLALLNTNQPGIEGKIRTMMVKALDKREARNLGAPEIGPMRFAMTDDDFAMQPAQRVGGSVFRVDPNGKPLPSDHGTYSAGVPGTPLGRLKDLIPAGHLFHDWSTANNAKINPDGIMFSTDWYTFGRQAPSQKITPELLDYLKNTGWIK